MGKISDFQAKYDSLNAERIENNTNSSKARAFLNLHVDALNKKIRSGKTLDYIVSLRAQVFGSSTEPYLVNVDFEPLEFASGDLTPEIRLAWFANELRISERHSLNHLIDRMIEQASISDLLETHAELLKRSELELKIFCKEEIDKVRSAQELVHDLEVESQKIRNKLDAIAAELEVAKQSWKSNLDGRIRKLEESNRISAPIAQLEELYGESEFQKTNGYFFEFLANDEDRWLLVMTYLTIFSFVEQRQINCRDCSTSRIQDLDKFRHLIDRHCHWSWKYTKDLIDSQSGAVQEVLRCKESEVWLFLGKAKFDAEALLRMLLRRAIDENKT